MTDTRQTSIKCQFETALIKISLSSFYGQESLFLEEEIIHQRIITQIKFPRDTSGPLLLGFILSPPVLLGFMTVTLKFFWRLLFQPLQDLQLTGLSTKVSPLSINLHLKEEVGGKNWNCLQAVDKTFSVITAFLLAATCWFRGLFRSPLASHILHDMT